MPLSLSPADSLKPPTWFEILGIPSLLLAFLFLIDNFFIPQAFTLPLLLLIVLVYLAYRLPEWIVSLWTLIYAGVIFVVLFFKIGYSQTIPALEPYIGTAIFLAGATVTTLLARNRRRLQKSNTVFFNLLSSLPLAVIVSNVSGDILLVNEEARRLLQGNMDGLSYFSTFINPNEQGQTIAKYIGYFDPKHNGTIPITLHTRQEPPLILHAIISVVKLDKTPYAVTVVKSIESAASRA